MDEAMAVGAARYADIIATLNGAGLPTVFTQTGGMCAALEVTLDNGQHLLITDAEDSLSRERAEQRGWGVGRYVTDSEYDDAALLDEELPGGAGERGRGSHTVAGVPGVGVPLRIVP